MAPKKSQQKTEAVKVTSEPEAAKEPDFNPHSIKVCLSLTLSVCLSASVCQSLIIEEQQNI